MPTPENDVEAIPAQEPINPKLRDPQRVKEMQEKLDRVKAEQDSVTDGAKRPLAPGEPGQPEVPSGSQPPSTAQGGSAGSQPKDEQSAKKK